MPPDGIRVDEYAKQQDKFAIDEIINLNPEGLIRTVHEKNISMCGYGPVAVMIVAAKLLGASKVELLKYGTSYEVHPSSSCVGYGSLVIY
jgi:AmmeMemoRadiSam system protein B